MCFVLFSDLSRVFAGCDLSRLSRFLNMTYGLKSSYETAKFLICGSSPRITQVVNLMIRTIRLPLKLVNCCVV